MATLMEYFDSRKISLEAERDSIKSELSTISQTVVDNQSTFEEKQKALSVVAAEIEALRIEIANALMPSDIDTLNTELREKLIEQREKNSELLSAQLDLEESKVQQSVYKEKLKRIESRLVTFNNLYTDTEIRTNQHSKWKEIIASDELTDYVAHGQTLLDERETVGDTEDDDIITIRAALVRVNADIPEVLRLRAQERHSQLSDYLQGLGELHFSLRDAYGDYQNTNLGPNGELEKLNISLLKEESELRDFAQNCLSLYGQAVTQLEYIVDSPELTDAERDRIFNTDLETDATPGLTQEAVRDAAKVDVDNAYAALQIAIAAAKASKPTDNPNDDTDVQTAQGLYDGAVTALEAEESSLTAEMRENIEAWEATIPNFIWQNLIAYDRAITQLTTLTTTTGASLVSDFESAEAAYTQAMVDSDELLPVEDDLGDTVSTFLGKVNYHNDIRQARVLSVVRGDN